MRQSWVNIEPPSMFWRRARGDEGCQGMEVVEKLKDNRRGDRGREIVGTTADAD